MLFIFGAGGQGLHAQKFSQTLKWNEDDNVLEYKIDIQDSSGKIIQSVTTENSFIDISLKEGSYKYRVTAYDLLGREAVSTGWISFEVAVAKKPEVAHSKKLEALKEDGRTLEIELSVDDVSSDTLAELVNVKTKERITGVLILAASDGAAASGAIFSEKHKANMVRFTDVGEGNWKLVITNPSGYSTETEAFEVRDVIKEEKLAAQKAEEERLAREKAELEERLAREKAEQEEKERLAREQAEREEAERLAREELERQEAERLAKEEAEREEAERREAERLAKEAEKEERRRRPAIGFEVKAGPALSINTFNADYLSEKNYDPLTKDQWPSIITPAPFISISYVPNLSWRIKPGIELTAYGFIWEKRLFSENIENWELKQSFCPLVIQGNLIAQIYFIPNKLFCNLKAGGGLMAISVKTEYVETAERPSTGKGFIYPKLNGGLSLELTPVKHLAFELGADYNIVISDKINFSFIMPYFEVGVRF